jgi:hypothetical protein
MRPVVVLLLTLVFAGCAYLPPNVSQVQMTARNGGEIYQGAVRQESPAVVKIIVEIDRRTYEGTLELTEPNTTFGLYQLYGPTAAAPKSGAVLGRTTFTKAIMSSTDQRVMHCDFTDVRGLSMAGLCIDQAQRVYDVIFS